MSSFNIVNRRNQLADFGTGEIAFMPMGERLASLGWNQVQWGKGSIKMHSEALPKVLAAGSAREIIGEMAAGVECLSPDYFFEAFGDDYAGYLRGEAPTLLAAATQCLQKAERKAACPHTELIDEKDKVHCPTCNLTRYKSAAEIVADLFALPSLPSWELDVCSTEGRVYHVELRLKGYATLTDTHRIRALLNSTDLPVVFHQETAQSNTNQRSLLGIPLEDTTVAKTGQVYERTGIREQGEH